MTLVTRNYRNLQHSTLMPKTDDRLVVNSQITPEDEVRAKAVVVALVAHGYRNLL